ncbi:MAG: DUF2666 family protein [Candidatus Iainarchaeum archaeon]|uniref:DUF2666 family protein n=1 Tax=Candidatus Iainarchaeum sp. TaxID=3101447 RepID=A0A7T9DKL6_9ARCH|nr:MAG: DUF2666 family protein [Candidatus Diapherotrites archaeon]
MTLTPAKIQFIANYPAWQCIKKFAVTEQTDPKTVGEFFVSYSISIENRLEKYLSQSVDMQKVKELIAAAPTGKTAGDIPSFLQYVSSSTLEQRAHTIGKNPHMGKIVHAYIVRTLFKQNGLMGDYSGVEIPGLKRLMKKKKGI